MARGVVPRPVDGTGNTTLSVPVPVASTLHDLTVMDFFLWGYLKSKLYGVTPYSDLQTLTNAIKRETASVPLEMIQRSIRHGYVNRLRKCLLRHSRQVEVYGEDEVEEGEAAEEVNEPMPSAPEAPAPPDAPVE